MQDSIFNCQLIRMISNTNSCFGLVLNEWLRLIQHDKIDGEDNVLL